MKLYFKKITSIALLLVLIICIIPVSVAKANEENRYCGYGSTLSTQESTTEIINFTNRVPITYQTVNGVPKYNQISDLSNACGAIAGAMVVGFYDKYYEELIPDYKTYVGSGTYRGRDSVYIPKLMRELYTLMRTNIDDVGVSETDCLNGLKSYVEGKGRTLTYTNVRYVNHINETTYTNAINNNHPVLLFCSKMDLYSFSLGENQDKIICTTYTGGHVAVGYGVAIMNYYNGDTIFRTDRYISVATGLGISMGYLKIESTDWCNGAYEVTIT